MPPANPPTASSEPPQPVPAPPAGPSPHAVAAPEPLTPAPAPVAPVEDLPIIAPPPPPPSWRDKWRSTVSTLLLLLLAPLIAWSISAFALQSYQVSGPSMMNTLQDQDRLIVNKVARTWARLTHHAYIPHRGDIIIFNSTARLTTDGQSSQLIKRVIGLPGERVVYKLQTNTLTIYNSAHPQGFQPDKNAKYQVVAGAIPGDKDWDIILAPDELFVCGDNRINSEDSRYFGPIKAQDIVGKLTFRIIPFNKAEKF